MQKKRTISLLLAIMMLFSLLPTSAFAAEGDSIVIQTQRITTSTTSVTVNVAGYTDISNATLRLSTGPEGTESDWGMSNPPRTTLGSQEYTGASEYTFTVDSSKLIEGQNVQAYLYYWSDAREDWRYAYGTAVEIADSDQVPSAAITTTPATNRTTELKVQLKHLPSGGIFRIVELEAGESYDSSKLNSYTSLYFSVVSNLQNGENTLTLTQAPTAGNKVVAVIRDSSGSSTNDYTSEAITVEKEQEPSIVSIVGTVDDASKQVTVNLTRVPSSGVLKVIALDAGESIPSNVFDYDYSGALYTGYFYSAGLKTGNNTLALSAAPAAGKVLYAVAREYASGGTNDYVSEGISVTSAVVPFAMYIKGQLTNESTLVSFVPKMKRYNDTARTLRSAALYRAGAEEPIAQVQSPAMGEAMTFSGLSGLTAGEKLKLVVLYDDDKTAEWEYVVCDASEADSFEIVEKSFTTSSTTITVKVSGYSWYTNRGDWSRICISTGSASQTQPGDDEGREDLTSQIFTGKGTYTFTIPTNKLDELKEGNSIMAALRFYDGNGIEGIEDHEYYAAADSVLISKATVSKTPLERLANCSVTMMKNGKPRTENFRQEKTTVDYAVTLDDEISSATLGFYAYPGTVAFDPDGNHKLNLGSVTVTKSGSGSLSLDLTKVPVGYRVIASLYVCIDGDDWYRHVNSVQMPEVVDENGNGFQDYAYPDATIDETELQAGATSLHVSVTGDERFFQYAKAGKISIYLAIAQYPEGQTFDFEGEGQIALVRSYTVREPLTHQEFTFTDNPLKAGYRVRAVVYWTQNEDLYIAPGNDYEAGFHKPDDSVLISGIQETEKPTVAVKGSVREDAASIPFTLGGTIPTGTILLVKSYDAGTTEFTTTTGTLVGSTAALGTGETSVSVASGSLSAGKKVVGYLLLSGELQAQSQPVTVSAAETGTEEEAISIQETSFTVDSTTVTVNVSGLSLFQGCTLFLTTGTTTTNNDADSRTKIGSQRYQGSGSYTFTIKADTLKGGNTVQAYLYRYDVETDRTYYKYSNAVAIEKEPTAAQVSITTKNVTADSSAVSIKADFDGSALLTLYAYQGDSFDPTQNSSNYVGIKYLTSASSSSQKIELTKTLQENDKLIAVLWSGGLGNTVLAQSAPVTVAKAPEKEKPVAYLLTQKVTAGMTAVSASLRFDSSISSADYKLYQFTSDTLDSSTAEVLNSGSLYRTTTNQTIYLGIGKLKVGSKLQLVLTAGGEEARSNVITVEPSPDWGTPYTAFSVSAVKSNAKTVSLSTDYSDEYLTMGDDFYCDVTVYACSGGYTDDEIEDKELWENYTACRTVAKANSRLGAATKGDLTLTLFETANLKAGEKLFIKLRLPHTEWEGEEVDYVSASIPVIGADDEIPAYQVVLYNLDQDSSRGARLRSILADLNIPVQEMTYAHLNETVGYLAGLDGYEAAEGAYDGKEYTTEFMLLCNLPETLLDRFLDAMQDNGLRIDHKAVVTAYNQDSCYYELMDEIANEHDVFQMLLTLNSMVTDSKKLTKEANGSSEHWNAFQKALSASDALLRSEEPTYEAMKAAYDALKAEYLAVTNLREITGEVAITISEEDGGTYTMTATVEEGLADASYQYTWSNGQTTQTITGIPADRLIATTVTVTSEGLYGKLSAQLKVPVAALPTVTAGSNALSVQLNAAGAGRNIPAATQYVVALYQGNTLVETKTVSTVQTVAFSGLSSGTAYTLKSYAVSPVGRSDILSQTVTTASGSSGGHTSGGGNSSRPSDPKPPVNDPSTGFTDVKNDAYYADAVKWAVDRGITNGQTTTLFGAEASCTRAQIVTFLWRAAGSPVLQTTKNPFTDLSEDAYYYQAVLWAVEQGITVGTTETTFDPDQTCTRGEAVTFLHRNAGEPVAAGNHGFQDVNGSDYYDNAVQWAREKNITSGTTETTFSPNARCSRGQIVTFLYRNLGN